MFSGPDFQKASALAGLKQWLAYLKTLPTAWGLVEVSASRTDTASISSNGDTVFMPSSPFMVGKNAWLILLTTVVGLAPEARPFDALPDGSRNYNINEMMTNAEWMIQLAEPYKAGFPWWLALVGVGIWIWQSDSKKAGKRSSKRRR